MTITDQMRELRERHAARLATGEGMIMVPTALLDKLLRAYFCDYITNSTPKPERKLEKRGST